MKKILFFVAISWCVILQANSFEKKSASYSLGFEVGQRVDNFDWNIGDADYLHTDNNIYHPNILSELIWKDIKSYYGKISLKGEEGPYRLKLSYSKSFNTFSGTNQDSDYLYNNRQGEFSRSNNDPKESSFEDYSIALGDNYHLTQNSNIVFWIGYEENKQNLTMTQGNQTIPNTGAFSGLNSTYDAKWSGGFFGFDLNYSYDKFIVATNIYYHIKKYDAKANWNLRTDFEHPVSFEHKIDKTTGYSYGIDLRYKYSSQTQFYIKYDALELKGKNGVNTQYNANGTRGGSRVDANWESQKLAFGVEYKF